MSAPAWTSIRRCPPASVGRAIRRGRTPRWRRRLRGCGQWPSGSATSRSWTRRSACAGPARGLVTWRERVAVEKRRSYAAEPYWGRPVPGFGAALPSILILGLAPAAHGANRTGRVFTGDRSGDFLFAAMHRAGLASAPDSVDAADGLVLNDTRVVAAVRCAPPDNKPLPEERATCAPWLDAEWRLIAAVGAGDRRARRVRVAGGARHGAGRRWCRCRHPRRSSATSRRPRSASSPSSAAITPASRTPSPAG